MAKLKFGSIVVSASGSLGGHTIQNSRGGAQLRTKPINKKPPTPAQTRIRNYNSVMQNGWKALTDEQRIIWDEYAINYGVFNKNGDKHTLSGHSVWMKYQFTRLAENLPFLDNPVNNLPTYLGPELIDNGDFSSSDGWFLSPDFEIYDNALHIDSIGNQSAFQVNKVCDKCSYQFITDVEYTDGALRVNAGSQNPVLPSMMSTAVFVNNYTVSNPTNTYIYIQAPVNFSGLVNSFSMREIFNF